MSIYSDILRSLPPKSTPRQGGSVKKKLKVGRLIEIEDFKSLGTKFSKKYQRQERKLLVRLKHNLSDYTDVIDAEEIIAADFKRIIDSLTQDIADNSFVTIYLSHRELSHEIFIRPFRKKDFTSTVFLEAIATVAQSNNKFLIDGYFEMTFGIVKERIGGGRVSQKCSTITDLIKSKRSIYPVADDGTNSCFWRALAIGIHDNENREKLSADARKNYRRYSGHKADAQKHAYECGRDYLAAVPISSVLEISRRLNINIIVVCATNNKRLSPISSSDIDASKPFICLLYVEREETPVGHYHTINSITGYFSSPSSWVSDFCFKCWVMIKGQNIHKCSTTCFGCSRQNSNCNKQERNECDGCSQICFGLDCLTYHKEKICEKFKLCSTCSWTFLKKENHSCLDQKCSHCYEKYNPMIDGLHYCYLKTKNMIKLKAEDSRNKLHVAFDIESMFVPENGMLLHVAVLLVSMSRCDVCLDSGSSICSEGLCERKPRIFRGDQLTPNEGCISDFSDYLYKELSEKAQKKKALINVYAHNFSGYDGQFILEDFFTRGFKQPTMIFSGSKILNMKTANISFIDTLKIFSLPLAKLPASFNIAFQKGYFTYLKNVPENRGKIIDYPSKEDFGFSQMKPEEQEKFSKWYDEQDKTRGYDLEKEMEFYCIDDVNVLIESVAAFRKEFKQITELDPTTRHFTLASIGMETFRATTLIENKLGLTPNTYAPFKASMTEEAWLNVMEDKLRIEITREFPIGKYRADGVCVEKKMIFEYNGCRWHGCKCIFKNENEIVSERDNKSVKDIRIHDKNKMKFYKTLLPDFTIIIAKDCENEDKLETDAELHRISTKYKKLEKLALPRVLEVRRALRGGRTNNARFYFETDGTNQLMYMDFTSLYPTVVKQEKYPMGHPKRLTRNFDYTLQSYFGLVYCSVEAPKQMRFPVLGDTLNGKFVFALCRTCAEKQQRTSCKHTIVQRLLYGVWTTVELNKAVEHGYKIHEIFEVLHYEDTCDKLFSDYIKLWQREKQEAEGKDKFQTEEELLDHIEAYLEREDVSLRADKMVKNSGRRYIAKLMLNSFWGKFAQRRNLSKSKLVAGYDELLEMYNNPDLEITGERCINNDTLFLTYKFKDESKDSSGSQNVAVAAFVTSYARLRLFDVMNKQETKYPNSVYYYDTDSIIFEARPGDDIPKLGPFLGDLTDELPGRKCIEASFNGPKCYSLKTVGDDGSVEYVLKIKGLTLMSSALTTISHDKMLALSKQYEDKAQERETLPVPQSRFVISKATNHIHSRSFTKSYRVTSDKRRVLDKQNNTVPYGYVD